MRKYQRYIDVIKTAVQFGVLPMPDGNPTEDEVNAKIEDLFSREPENPEAVQQMNKLIYLIDRLEEKGVMDELYPNGWTIKKPRLFKKKK